MRFLASLSPFEILRQLRRARDASTFERLGQSRHVADLRLIFSVTAILMIVASIVTLAFCFEYEVVSKWQDIVGGDSIWIWVRMGFAALADSGVVVGAVGAAGCGVLVWTYQTGSARLGVVDLFACEIATLCRVAAVIDMVPRYIGMYRSGGTPLPGLAPDGEQPSAEHFTSQESYFPVFDASVRDLQQLEADVVTNVTAFYTYMKVMRDGLRKLTELRRPHAGNCDDDWHRALCNVIYMQFLALESGRKALCDLVEFEPTQAENICTVLLSELPAYGFLREQFSGDLRQRRLDAREAEYRRLVPELYRTVVTGSGPHWERARDLAEGTMQVYAEIIECEPSKHRGRRRQRAVAA
ncbi:MAG: hypothetical protein JO001_14570 [Alphaproteobacteria bacterium]|nr:hypothetical protein [Alphaproteobacteria bacterium]